VSTPRDLIAPAHQTFWCIGSLLWRDTATPWPPRATAPRRDLLAHRVPRGPTPARSGTGRLVRGEPHRPAPHSMAIRIL